MVMSPVGVETKNHSAGEGQQQFTRHLLLGQMRVAVVRSEKLLAEAGESSGTQRKGNVRNWKPLPSNGW
jgi:hypothetical protein